MSRFEKIRSIDLVQILSIIFLLGMGLLTVYSATFEMEDEMSGLYEKQLVFVVVSVVVFIIVLALPQRFYFACSYLVYGIALGLLVLVLLLNPGSEPARWFNLGFAYFQPSEAAKLAMILTLARFLDAKKKIVEKLSVTIRALLISVVPALLVVMEPDLGTAVIFLIVSIPMMVVGGISVLHLLIMVMPLAVLISSISVYILIPAIVIFFFIMLGMRFRLTLIVVFCLVNIAIGISAPKLWSNLHPYQQRRIKTFMNPEADPHGAGYQVIQSKIAVGSGGLWGKGYLKGTQGHLKFLPAGHTDFIFSVFCEEMGFIGAGAVLAAFFLLVYRGLVAAGRCRNKFSQLVIVGGSAYFASHALVNIGMALGLLPVTGLPLPFMSYGGSSLMQSMALAGIMVGLGMRWWEY